MLSQLALDSALTESSSGALVPCLACPGCPQGMNDPRPALVQREDPEPSPGAGGRAGAGLGGHSP